MLQVIPRGLFFFFLLQIEFPFHDKPPGVVSIRASPSTELMLVQFC